MVNDDITDEELGDLLERGVVALETMVNYFCGTPEDRKIVEEAIAVFGPDDPIDLEDDTFAMGKECPNCGHEREDGFPIEHGLGGPRYICMECHHAWNAVVEVP